jgi:hypothetical protein
MSGQELPYRKAEGMSKHMTIVLGAPGAAEMPLLADLGVRDDLEILGVVDPTGEALGSSIAEIMGLPVVPSLADLAPPAELGTLLILPAGPPSLVAALAGSAEELGLEAITTTELRARLFERRPAATTRERPPLTRPGLEEIERETASIQETLAGLEDALAGDAILKRLLELATRAAGASGGSIMLYDQTSGELYIAYATGLSEGTLHGTRVKLGEGIAGRVARTRKAELITGSRSSDERRRDRPDIATAICAPLVADRRLLGVLNLSTQTGEPPFDETARDMIVGLSVRLGVILDGVQQLQLQRTSRIFDLTEQQLRRLAVDRPHLPAMLTAWCEALAVTADSARVSLVVPCEDGGLLVCENTPGGSGEHWYESLHNPAWLEVLPKGTPLVARQTDLDGASAPITVFYLPIGRDPVRAGMAIHFTSSRTAHGYHALAGEMVFLLERLLADQLAQRRQQRRADQLADLSSTLSALTAHQGTPGQRAELLCQAARHLTGARYVAAVASIDVAPPRLAGGNVPEEAAWLAELPRLLRSAAADGWRITTLETDTEPLSVLTAVSREHEAAPGLVLLGKHRLHELDGGVFTPLDAELIVPLAGAISKVVPHEVSLVSEIVPVVVDIERPQPANDAPAPASGEEKLLEDLRRELDRCDRYHNVCGLVVLRPDLPREQVQELLQTATRKLGNHLRISDRLYALPDGTLAVLVPEDVQRLDRVQARLQMALRELAGDPGLAVAASRVAYPASSGTAETLLERVRSRLDH